MTLRFKKYLYNKVIVICVLTIYIFRLTMDPTSNNQDYDNDENKYGMGKFKYFEKYGVKRFPYSGMRKYPPSINQSRDRGIFISNDLFGLTIKQFERVYKDCLNRRKTKNQWILNLRYPEKSSNEYLEYLNNCTDRKGKSIFKYTTRKFEKNLNSLKDNKIHEIKKQYILFFAFTQNINLEIRHHQLKQYLNNVEVSLQNYNYISILVS